MSRGFSTVVGPEEDILTDPLIEEGGIEYADIDPAAACAMRHEFDPFGDYSRPDVFRLVIDDKAKLATSSSSS